MKIAVRGDQTFELFDVLPIGILVIDKAYNVLYWNRCVERWTKIERDIIVGKPLTAFFPLFAEPAYTRRLDSIFAGGPPVVFSCVFHKTLLPVHLPDAPERLQDTTVSAIRLFPDGAYAALFAIQDMTNFFNLLHNYRISRDQAIEEMREHKFTGEEIQRINQRLGRRIIQRTAALAASEERYCSLLENVPVGILLINFSQVREALNAADAHAKDKLSAAGRGEIQHWVGLLKIESVNKVALQLYEARDHNELIEKNPVYGGASGEEVLVQQLSNMDHRGEAFTAEYRTITLRGTERYVSLQALVAPGSEQTWERVLVTIMDVTARKEAEMALRQAHQELEKRVALRTRQLSEANRSLQAEIAERMAAEKALQSAMTELQRSNKELEQFAYIASHDLKEPLRKVKIFGQRLQERYENALDERGRDYLDRMENAIFRMEKLIDDLLILSRVTSKARPFLPVDLNQICEGVLKDLEVRIEQTGGQVVVHQLPQIDADALQMRQLFQNLIGNALKFHRKEVPPAVEIQEVPPPATSEAVAAAPVDLCCIEVRDNGIGIAPAFLEGVFKPFHRLHTRNEYEGTGMGLAVCQKIVDRHGGQIHLRSTPGQGSVFSIILPKHQSRPPVDEQGTGR